MVLIIYIVIIIYTDTHIIKHKLGAANYVNKEYIRQIPVGDFVRI